MKVALALFDFDGTITKKDTLLEFIKFYKGHLAFYAGLFILSPLLILFKMKLIRNYRAKEIMLSYFFRGSDIDVFNSRCLEFAEKEIPKLVRPKAIKKLKDHIIDRHHVVVVSASAENWILPWSSKMGIELIGTKLEVKENKITGKLLGKNCYGPEKVTRVNDHLNGLKYEKIYAYGDSNGDKELLNFATHPYYRFFH